MQPDYDYLFANQAEKYDRLVSAEDFQGSLLHTLTGMGLLNREQAVADLGTGTGRVAFLLAPIVRHVYGIEPVGGMLRVAEAKKAKLGIRNVDFLPGEHKDTSLPAKSIDVIIEGWAFLRAYRCTCPEWRAEFDAILKEMQRIARHRATVILIETMGTLKIWDKVPTGVTELYEYFEKELGLRRSTIRTDYRFADAGEAAELSAFFFGDEIGAEIRGIGSSIVPEATAIWHGRL